MKSKSRPDGRTDWRGHPKPSRGRPPGSGMTLLQRFERMDSGDQASLALNRREVRQLLPLVRNEDRVKAFIRALRFVAAGKMPRGAVEFMFDELVHAFEGVDL